MTSFRADIWTFEQKKKIEISASQEYEQFIYVNSSDQLRDSVTR